VDAMAAYLMRSASGLLRVGALLAASDDGRYLVVLSEAQEPLLYDAQTDSIASLADQDLDLRADGLRGSIRSIAFSPDGSRVAMLTRGRTPRIVVRELPNGPQTSVTPLGSTVWRVSFDGGGKFVVLYEVLDDTNRNGRMDWPIPERALRNTRCTAMVGALDAWIPSGDAAVTSVASIKGGNATRVDGFVSMLGSKTIVKVPGENLATLENGRAKRLGMTDCDAHVIALSAQYGQILTSCTDKSNHALLELSSLSGSRTYQYEGLTSFIDRTEPEVNRFRALYSGVRTYLVDFSLAQVTMLQDRDQLLAQGKAGLIVRRSNQVLLIHPAAGQPELLLDDVRAGTRIQLGPGHVLVGNELFSASQGKRLGRVEHPVLSVSANGCVLLALGTHVNGDPLLKGPLQWSCPGS
jgi:hypothetical protein